jgi:hypothetical protein
LDVLRDAVESFNEQSSLGQIRIQSSASAAAWQTYIYDIPFAGAVQLRFFRLEPPINLRRGQVRLFGHLADTDGTGFNFVLFRKGADDIYGEWQVCKIGVSATVDPRKHPPRPEPFGFKSGQEFREHMQYSDGTMHIYTYQFEPVSPDQFLEIVIEFIKRKRKAN